MSERTRDFAPDVGLHLGGVQPDPVISYENDRLSALADASTDHDGVEKIKRAMIERTAKLSGLSTPRPCPLPPENEVRASMATARARLRVEFEAHQAARSAHTGAVNALDRGRNTAEDARGALAGLGDVDALVAAWRAGRTAAGKTIDPLPDDLRHRRDEADRLRRDLADAERTVAVLADREQAMRQRVVAAGSRVDDVIAVVIDHQSALLAIAMEGHQQAAFALLRQISALGHVTISGRRYRITPPVDRARDRDPRPWTSVPINERDKPRLKWLAAIEKLRVDPDATLGD